MLNETNRKIIDAIIKKAERECPRSLALIGVYGSVLTGDTHERSDLDLLILLNDEDGRRLSDGFILDDACVGYDIYCTTREMLHDDAECTHAHLSKLLDSEIVYEGDETAKEWLFLQRERAKTILSSEKRFERAEKALADAKSAFAECFLSDSVGDVRFFSGEVIYHILNSVMLYHGKYFRFGVKRTFEELYALGLPFDLPEKILSVIKAVSVGEQRREVTSLLHTIIEYYKTEPEKEEPSHENLSGTYEEMYSNWKNKMREAEKNGDVFSSFMNTMSLYGMLLDIENGVSVGIPNGNITLVENFDSENLSKNRENFDRALLSYLDEYKKIGLHPKRFSNVDEFINAYLKN